MSDHDDQHHMYLCLLHKPENTNQPFQVSLIEGTAVKARYRWSYYVAVEEGQEIDIEPGLERLQRKQSPIPSSNRIIRVQIRSYHSSTRRAVGRFQDIAGVCIYVDPHTCLGKLPNHALQLVAYIGCVARKKLTETATCCN